MRNWRVSGLLSAAQWTQDYKLARSRYAVARDLKGVTARELARGKEHLRTLLAVGSTSTL